MRIYRKRFSVNGWSLGVWPRHIYIRVTDGRQKQYSVCGPVKGKICVWFLSKLIGETSFRFLKNCVNSPPLMILVNDHIEFTWNFYLIWLPMLKDISVLVVLSLLFTLVLKKIWSESKYCSFNSSTPTD